MIYKSEIKIIELIIKRENLYKNLAFLEKKCLKREVKNLEKVKLRIEIH